MKNTLVVCSYNRPMLDQARSFINSLKNHGALFHAQRGTADVALARNVALTQALTLLKQRAEALEEPATLDGWVVLMLDDDIISNVNSMQQLVDEARRTGVPCSAVYATLMSTIAGSRIKTTDTRQRWLAGLGCLAIPVQRLLELQAVSQSFELRFGEPLTEFTWSGGDKGSWYSEDYCLTRRLGGVYMMPIAVGHLKVIPIEPDDFTIDAIARGDFAAVADPHSYKPFEMKPEPTASERAARLPAVERIEERNP